MNDDLISRQRLLKELKHHKELFCRNRIEFLGLSKNDKARADEIDNCIATVINMPSAQAEQQHGRIFQGIVVEYLSYNTYPEYKGKPYFSIKYTENGQEFIGYGTYKPEVLSEFLKEYFMPPAQPEQPTLYGYNIEHLARIAILLREENLPTERVAEALTDIGRIVSIVRAECEEEFRKAVERCMI